VEVTLLKRTVECCDSKLLAAAGLRVLVETILLLRTVMGALPRRRPAIASDCCS